MLWKLKEDAFTFTINLPPRPLTRRGILSALSSLFDPLGFVSPVILEGRVILKGLCRRKAGWDEVVTHQEVQKWQNWISRLNALGELNISRCFGQTSSGSGSVEIHSFSLASSYAYGACCYLRVERSDGAPVCSS